MSDDGRLGAAVARLAAGALLDGAMGTALLARGLPESGLPEDWLALRPEEIAAVHAAHAAAGARILLTCTFNAARPRLADRLAPGALEALCAKAVRLARTAAPEALVAGDLGPTALARPGAAGGRALGTRYDRPARALAAAGADLLWLETQYDVSEALGALAAARRTGLPVVVTFALVERDDRLVTPGGATAEGALAAVAAEGAAAVGVNCVAPGAPLAALASWAKASLPVPFAAKPSPGLPGRVLAPGAFAAAVHPAIRAGARLVGGCCGATAAHLEALAAELTAT